MASDDLSQLGTLVGKPCWSAAAALNREWLVVLDLGERMRRSLRLANPTLNFQQRTYEGSHTIVIEGSWRLDGPDRVLATCLDVRQPTDRIQAALDELEGRLVVSADAPAPAHDLIVGFEGGYFLRAFVLEPLPPPAVSVPEGERSPPPSPRPPGSCWTVSTPEGQVKVGPHGDLKGSEGPQEPPPSGLKPGPKLALVESDYSV